MSIWDGVPYELQSPTWRSGMQNVGTAEANQTWNPTLNESWVTKFLDFKPTTTTSGTATAAVDGSTSHTNWLQGLTGAILSGIGSGANDEIVATPVAYQPQQTTIAGLPLSTVAMLGLGAAAIYYIASK